MATPSKQQLMGTLKPIVKPPPVVAQAQREMALVIPALTSEVVAITINTEDDYLQADVVLAKVRTAKKTWVDRLEAIIRPARQSLDLLYDLNRDGVKPLEKLEGQLKTAMADYKTQERRQLEAAQRAKEEEDQRIADALQATQEAEAKARTAPMRAKLAAAREALENQQQAAAEEPVSAPVQANHSTTRAVKRIRPTDMGKILMAIIAGKVPYDVVQVNQVVLNSYLKITPEAKYLPVTEWPGVEVYDDTQIVGR